MPANPSVAARVAAAQDAARRQAAVFVKAQEKTNELNAKAAAKMPAGAKAKKEKPAKVKKEKPAKVKKEKPVARTMPTREVTKSPKKTTRAGSGGAFKKSPPKTTVAKPGAGKTFHPMMGG